MRPAEQRKRLYGLRQNGLIIGFQKWGNLQHQSLNLLDDANVGYVEFDDVLCEASYRPFGIGQGDVDTVLGIRREKQRGVDDFLVVPGELRLIVVIKLIVIE